jgi:hypothetical protein
MRRPSLVINFKFFENGLPEGIGGLLQNIPLTEMLEVGVNDDMDIPPWNGLVRRKNRQRTRIKYRDARQQAHQQPSTGWESQHKPAAGHFSRRAH